MDSVAAVDFLGGVIPDAQWNRLAAGRHLLVLRSGLMVDGLWDDVGGTRPLRITCVSDSGSRDYASTEVARILLAPRGTSAPSPPVTPPPTTPPPGGPCDLAALVGSWNAGAAFGQLLFQPAGGCFVRGTYAVSSNGSVAGALTTAPQGGVMLRVVQFRWTRSDNADIGEAFAVISPDGSRMDGRWCRPANCDARQGAAWAALRQSGSSGPPVVPPPPAPAPNSACSGLSQLVGTWSTSGFGDLTIENPSGCSVTGRYTASAGTIRGTASGNAISFQWIGNGEMGDGRIVLTGPGTLTGTWCRPAGCNLATGTGFTGTKK